MQYEQALEIIKAKQSLGIKPGLSAVEALLKKMGSPQEKLRVIHIAGTNGKGTVANLIASGLSACGLRVGLFTSPWVVDYREQISINGAYIPKERLCEYISLYGGEGVTEFELFTAVMYKYFYDERVDYAVVECGMGGKLDATNALSHPQLCVITSVSMDHTDFLGKSLCDIASQKAGIIKNGCACVLYPNPACEAVFENRCKETGSRLIKVREQGDFKKNNLAVAGECLAFLGQCAQLEYPALPARQEYLADNMMLDGAHNEDGARALLKALPAGDITAVISMMADKDYDSYLRIIAPRCKSIIATEASNPRALSAQKLARAAAAYCGSVAAQPDPHLALKAARERGGFILVCGSFFLARDLRKDML